MPRKPCYFEGCGEPSRGLGLCAAHWHQQHIGRPLTPIHRTVEARIKSRSETQANGCIIFNGSGNGRGHMKMGIEGKRVYVHRYVYEQTYGPIPEGREIDHQCRNRSCINPEHLRAVTHKENMENLGLAANNTSGYRGVSWSKVMNKWEASVQHHRKTHRGYFFDTAEEANDFVIGLRRELYTNVGLEDENDG